MTDAAPIGPRSPEGSGQPRRSACSATRRWPFSRAAPEGNSTWTLPGGGVEPGEDPFDAVTRELAEETGCDGVVERLLGVDSRVIPSTESRLGTRHQNVGIYYLVRVVGGELRPEPDGATAESVWTPIADVAGRRRSSLVETGLALARTAPVTGHVAPVPLGGLIQH